MSGNKLIYYASVAILGSLAILFLYFQKDLLFAFLEWISGLGWVGYALFVIVFTIVGFPFTIGYIPLAVGGGYLYGMIYGTILVSLGAASGAAVSFWICRHFFYDWMKEKLSKSPKWDLFMIEVETNAWKLTLLIRLLPFPFGFVNGLFALSTISFHVYLIGSFIGLLPFQIMWTYFGTTLRSLTDAVDGMPFTMWQQILLGIQIVAGIGLLIYLIRLGRSLSLPNDVEMGIIENEEHTVERRNSEPNSRILINDVAHLPSHGSSPNLFHTGLRNSSGMLYSLSRGSLSDPDSSEEDNAEKILIKKTSSLNDLALLERVKKGYKNHIKNKHK